MKRPGTIPAACFVFVLAAATWLQAQTFTVLHTFTGGSDGGLPQSDLIIDAAGNLYGTTAAGGTSSNCAGGCGTVFKTDAVGNETVLHSFTGGSDGAVPFASLVKDAAGNLYGTTFFGGAWDSGTVFKLDTLGNESVVYAFTGGADGGNPAAALILDAAGNLYGTTGFGGSGALCPLNCGTVFKLDTSGKETVLYNFTGGGDGARPFGVLIMDAAGNMYSTTVRGGSPASCENAGTVLGCGTVFKLDTSGNETVLHRFTGSSDGGRPFAGLIMDAAGNLYSTTSEGGPPNTSCGAFACGTVFQLDSSGNETVLHSFSNIDGAFPSGRLIKDAFGNLYSTTSNGGAFGTGTVFQLDSFGNETVLHSFSGPDGANPAAGLIMDTAGNLYGTAATGGGNDNGTLFKIVFRTPQQATQAVINEVTGLAGLLNGGQDNSLVRHLQHAIELMNSGHNAGAIDNLNAFIGEITDLASVGVISPSQAQSLINAANSVIGRLT